MAKHLFANFARATLTQPLAAASGDSVAYFSLASFSIHIGAQAQIVLTNADESLHEICTLKQRQASGRALITRGQENTTPLDWPVGTIVEQRLTAGVLDTFLQLTDANAIYRAAVTNVTSDGYAPVRALYVTWADGYTATLPLI